MIFLLILFQLFLFSKEVFSMNDTLVDEIKHKKRHLVEHVNEESQTKKETVNRKRVKKSLPVENVTALSSCYARQDQVSLIKGKGSKDSGGGKGGFYWAVMYDEKKVGKVFINLIDTEPLGKHPSIQIYLNKASQGKHIGRWAYQKACLESTYDIIYAHISKKNKASHKAALAAGFVSLTLPHVTQLVMRWERH